MSLESYQMIPEKYKTDLFSSNIKIKAANGTIIKNNGECDITFRMGTEKFTIRLNRLIRLIFGYLLWLFIGSKIVELVHIFVLSNMDTL